MTRLLRLGDLVEAAQDPLTHLPDPALFEAQGVRRWGTAGHVGVAADWPGGRAAPTPPLVEDAHALRVQVGRHETETLVRLAGRRLRACLLSERVVVMQWPRQLW